LVQNLRNKRIKALPLLITWGIWIARNSVIFKEKYSLPDIIVAKSLFVLAHFPQEKVLPSPKYVMEKRINQTRPWDFFDGPSKDLGVYCAGGETSIFLQLIFII